MFGPGDSLLNAILALLRKIPVLPMFGRGLTRLQPVYVGDVAQAIARVLEAATTPIVDQTNGCVYSCAHDSRPIRVVSSASGAG